MRVETEKKIYSVSQLNRRAKQLLETHLPLIWVSGEISNMAFPASGHWYLTLKDDNAQVRCAMFRNANQRLRWRPKNGDQVLVRARVSLYEGRGDYQLIIEHMEAAGAGALQQQFTALKEKLMAEGLFDEARKKPLPKLPETIGVMTSPTGAAIQDILSVLARRYPMAHIIILPVAVQGEQAAPALIQGLKKAEQLGTLDVLIIGRGGGSIEDLWAFNHEALARAIADSSLPIVSAVGHETDFTICDFVADVRAPTPSASAELVSPDISEWMQTLDIWQRQLARSLNKKLQQQAHLLEALQKRLRHPGEKIKLQRSRLDHGYQGLKHSMQQRMSAYQQQLTHHGNTLQKHHPKQQLERLQLQLQQLQRRQYQALQTGVSHKQQAFIKASQLLEAVSPLAVLNRGYSLTTNAQGEVIKSSEAVNQGEQITVKLAKGQITGVVTDRLDQKD